MVEPAHVGRAALVALGVDALLERRVAERDHPALPGRDLLVRVEAEHGRMAAAADRHAVGVDARRAPRRRPRRSAGRAARTPAGRPGSRRCGRAAAPTCASVTAAAAAVRVEVERDRVDVGEHRPRALVDGDVGRGDERERARDDLVAVAPRRRRAAPGAARPCRSRRRSRAARRAARRTPARTPAAAARARAAASAAPRARAPPRASPRTGRASGMARACGGRGSRARRSASRRDASACGRRPAASRTRASRRAPPRRPR